TIVTVADPPSPRSPSAQLTVVPCALQRPWLAVADLNRTLRSSVSVRLTPRAVSKPFFISVTVEVRKAPATNGSGVSESVRVGTAPSEWAGDQVEDTAVKWTTR